MPKDKKLLRGVNMPRHLIWCALITMLLAVPPWVLGQPAGSEQSNQESSEEPRQLLLTNEQWTGDLDKLVERRMIRVLVPYSRTLYFIDKGTQRGLTAELVLDFERYVNRTLKTQKRPITVYIIPTTRDRLLPDVAAGMGDIAAGNLTITDERLRIVDFASAGVRNRVSEMVITGPKSPAVTTVEDLAGKTVHVRKASSYYESLVALNERFAREGKAAIQIILVPDALEDEDMMEMLNAGLLQMIVVDDWKAKMWAQVLPSININESAVLREEGEIGWAIRKDSPKLRKIIEEFDRSFVEKQGVAEYRLRQYLRQIKQVKDPTGTTEWKRLEQTLAFFEKYASRYNFDPLMLVAQGYQESQLNQEARSPVGAIGIMQVMPATGEEMKVGDITIAESNIHAGAKYMDLLMSKYFLDANFSEEDRVLFAFASYNAGPGNISRVRREAAKRGLDPDKWFNNVEVVVAAKIGLETTTYVRNIFKYSVAYKLLLEAHEVSRKARELASSTLAQIGQIKMMNGEVFVVRNGTKSQAKPGDLLQQYDVVETGSKGSVGITFMDNSRFSAGPNTLIELKRFRFNPTTQDGEFTTEMNRGTLAIISGQIAKRSSAAMKIKTPTTTIGVRATKVGVKVNE
jgi:membrane-bound lytic murein transglycosylase MltF